MNRIVDCQRCRPAKLKGQAKLIARNISTNNLRIQTQEEGTASFENFDQFGKLTTKGNEGTIRLQRDRSQ